MRLAILLGALFAISTSQIDAIRVQFPPGASSAKIKGTFGNESKVRYIVSAAAGQRIKVSLTALGRDYRFFVYAPKSDDPINGPGLAFEWSGVLPVTGNYVIQVFTDERDRSDPFELEISLTTGAKTHPVEVAADSEFSPDGYYVFSGRTPKDFANVKGFSLTTSEANPNGKPVPIPPGGDLDAGGKYKMVNIKVSGGALSFETRALRGASYKFEGKFLVTKGWCDDEKTTGPVLSGHLIRLLNGAKVAEAEVKFEWSCSDI